MTSSYLVPTTKRSCSTALARPGMALAGFSILPDDIASTSSVFQANSRSAGVSPSSPQSSASCGSARVPCVCYSPLAPFSRQLRLVGSRLDLHVRQRGADGVRNPRRLERVELHPPLAVDQARNGVAQDRRRVGEHTAPIAGMVAA